MPFCILLKNNPEHVLLIIFSNQKQTQTIFSILLKKLINNNNKKNTLKLNLASEQHVSVPQYQLNIFTVCFLSQYPEYVNGRKSGVTTNEALRSENTQMFLCHSHSPKLCQLLQKLHSVHFCSFLAAGRECQ